MIENKLKLNLDNTEVLPRNWTQKLGFNPSWMELQDPP